MSDAHATENIYIMYVYIKNEQWSVLGGGTDWDVFGQLEIRYVFLTTVFLDMCMCIIISLCMQCLPCLLYSTILSITREEFTSILKAEKLVVMRSRSLGGASTKERTIGEDADSVILTRDYNLYECFCSLFNNTFHSSTILRWVKNSWGSTWGLKGYFKIGYGECGIENTFTSGYV